MAGAAGYVLKQVRGPDLAGAVRPAAYGQSLLSPRAVSELMAGCETATSATGWPS